MEIDELMALLCDEREPLGRFSPRLNVCCSPDDDNLGYNSQQAGKPGKQPLREGTSVTQVVVSSCENLRHEVWAGRHTLAADEPKEVGGDDAGPTPYELLLAALGSCTSMTLLLYARRKQWSLEHVEVRLTHNRIHAKDCADCEQKEGYLDHVEKEIVVSGPLTDEQVQRLGEIAEKCPVNRTLHASIHTAQKIRRAGDPTPAG